MRELENELSTLKSQLTEEQDKNVRLIDKMKKLKKKYKVPVSEILPAFCFNELMFYLTQLYSGSGIAGFTD